MCNYISLDAEDGCFLKTSHPPTTTLVHTEGCRAVNPPDTITTLFIYDSILLYIKERETDARSGHQHLSPHLPVQNGRQPQFLSPYRGIFYTNGAEAFVSLSMLSRGNIRSRSRARLFPLLIGLREPTDKNRLLR